MTEPFFTSVNLECSCIRSASATFDAGSSVIANLTMHRASLSADISCSSAIMTSPGEFLTCSDSNSSNQVHVTGNGPYFIIKFANSFGNGCGLISAGWKLKTYIDAILIAEYDVVEVYEDDSFLVFGYHPSLNDPSAITFKVEGYAPDTPPNLTVARAVSAIIESSSELSGPFSIEFPINTEIVSQSEIVIDDISIQYKLEQLIESSSSFNDFYLDKITGNFGQFNCKQKLYPSSDIPIDSGFGGFIGPYKETENLYSFIDEGVYQGVLKDKGDSNLVSDDDNSFIQPDSVHSNGFFQYKCSLTNFTVRPEHSSFRIRASAPLENLESKTPPLYTIYNIRLLDPSGSLIIKYGDIQFKGDSQYSTYSSLPIINSLDNYDWQRKDSPILTNVSGYSLTFNVRAVSLDDPFNTGFDKGFEENYIIPDIFKVDGNNYLALDGSPISSQEIIFINPGNGLKISAIEICNSGGFGPRQEDYFPLYTEVPVKGRRLERRINPTLIQLNNFDTSIYPSLSNNLWVDDTLLSSALGVSNSDVCGAKKLTEIINTKNQDRFIKLDIITGGGVANSGKLILKFGSNYSYADEVTEGSFNFAFDQGTKNIWWNPSGAFNTQNRNANIQYDSIFYDVESVALRVLAKKAVGSRDYVLDVVGYSNDNLLNVTSPSGGFIQDPSGVYLNDYLISQTGNHPVLSGFYQNSNDWTLGGASLSEKENYFQASGNDHYKLAQYPIVTGTNFEWYEVPLKILDDPVSLGQSPDRSMSSMFEHLYLDIYPLPSGAAIAYAELCVRYAPANAVNFYTQGGVKIGKAQDGRSEGSLRPSAMNSYDDILNAGSGYQPVSYLKNIPHGYSTPNTIKTNYSRRWRGVDGIVRGPYDPDVFSFAFENPTIDYPFLSGYFKFDKIVNGYVKSSNLGPSNTVIALGSCSGLIIGNPQIHKNIGWRFSSGNLFNLHLPGYSGSYKSIDWTSLSLSGNTFIGNPLYGKISDSFDRVLRVNGQSGSQYVDFGNIDTVSGFSIFVRFSPDINVSGHNYNLFDSGVIYSKWSNASNLDFALAYNSGYLQALSKDSNGNIISATDTLKYDRYHYPISVLLTYNDNNSKKLKLYTDNEFAGNFDTLRASSTSFDRTASSGNILLGWSPGSGIGMNMFVSDFGISAWSSGADTIYGNGTNIVESGADKTYKQVTADDIFDNIRSKYFDPSESYINDRYKLWNKVNDDTYNSWSIGDFQYCQFGFGFSQLQKRPNKKHLVFELSHDGTPYANSDIATPSTINSGVSYHTQLENDFLRFHLSDVPNNFYSANRRITKNIPVGYKFSERAIVVETVIEHEFGQNISWSSCEDIKPSGPKLIVSLYTKKQEPYWIPTEPNWGLVNRKIHYIEPSSCIMRLDSTFDYDDLLERSEEWSIFPIEPRLRDFSERYFKDDVNQMFVQYDLVYPSGSSFDSKIYLHSSHVRMSDVNISNVDDSGVLNLNVSGAFPADGRLNLNVGGFPQSLTDSLPLTIQVPFPYDTFKEGLPSGFLLNLHAAFASEDFLNLYIPPQSGHAYFSLSVSGAMPSKVENSGLSLSLPVALGRTDTSNDGNPDTTNQNIGVFFGMPLTLRNAEITNIPYGPVLNLYTFASSGSTGLYSSLPTILYNISKNNQASLASGLLNMNIFGSQNVPDRRLFANMPLYINSPNIINNSLPLISYNSQAILASSGAMNLTTLNVPIDAYSALKSAFALWNNLNYGSDIKLTDNHVASIPANNEIRGVDIMAYGSCDSNSNKKAIQKALITDCTTWLDEKCYDAGIFRAKDTYTNSGAINFSGGIGYSGNYYGIRKFTNLIPSAPYKATITMKTGSTEAIAVPRTFEEWEYGMCGPNWHVSGCCTEDCDSNIVFSGAKIIGDDACGVANYSNGSCNDPLLLIESGRNADDQFGRCVAVTNDLLAISSPNLTIPDYSPYDNCTIDVSGAGSIYLYRRTNDVPGKKAGWSYIEQLILPVGYRKDYIQKTSDKLLEFDSFSISGNKWQIGQEGRKLGESLAICSSGDREIIVAGAPRAKWSRQFNDLKTSGIPTAAIIFADLFDYDKDKLLSVANTAKKFNILWKYFSAPWSPGANEWYAEINPKIIVLQPSYLNKKKPVIPTDESSWFVHRYIPRLDDFDLLLSVGSGSIGGSGTIADFIASGKPIVFNTIMSGVLDAFFTAFPSGSTSLYSGIPAIVGMFKEQTGSTAGALQYSSSNGSLYNVYDEFSKFYENYSLRSGVYDYVNNHAQKGHLNTVFGKSEQWNVTVSELLSSTFDSGRLSSTFTENTLNRNFITSGVGQQWGDTHGSIVSQFQIPPASGGKVFIFEKERNEFNCVQIISSNNQYEDIGSVYAVTYNDRFGHSVSISKNGNTISIGSPFNTTPCRIFERNEQEIQKIYNNIRSWCVFTGKNSIAAYYDNINQLSGIRTAQLSTYDLLSKSDRFAYRNDINFWNGNLPQQYSESYHYSYNDIEYIGTRQILPQTFASTSRLGWSTAVDDDGEMVAFGAPTDSFNEFDDTNVWGDNIMSWSSYNNAGAVRIFQNRKYYPHEKIVELGRFGNLDRSSHPDERKEGWYDEKNWNSIFGSGADGTPSYAAKQWSRLPFSAIDIPQDAGLAFIITPEIDSASDEVIKNIKNWLALGDRNLVIVGNDPVWEDNGLYEDSNKIVNKILEKLGSRMRIHPAKDRTYSVQSCVSQEDVNNEKYNITRSLLPKYSAGRTISANNLFAKGVGDIRINLQNDGLENYVEYMSCPEGATCGDGLPPIINERYEFPLKNEGDLRAEWIEQCVKTTPTTCSVVTYKKNWPLMFKNFSVNCDNPPQSLFDKPNQEPVPVLTTMEHIPAEFWYKPETSGKFCDYRPIYEYETNYKNVEFYKDNIDEIAFSIQENGDSAVSGKFNSFTYNGDFFDPDKANSRDAILQATGRSFYPEDEEKQVTETLSSESIVAIVESGRKTNGQFNNSRVYLIATQLSETDSSRGITKATLNDDKNTEFYVNIVRKNCLESPCGIQINGFTRRSSLNNAYFLNGDNNDGHTLGKKLNLEFISNGGFFRENQSLNDLNEIIDFAWIANPLEKPSDQDLIKIQNWLDVGNKKLIITYNASSTDFTQQVADNVAHLLSGISITSRPFFLPKEGNYFVTDSILYGYNRPEAPFSQRVNYTTDSISGCDNGYAFTFPNYQYATSMSGIELSVNDDVTAFNILYNQRSFVPISGGQNYEKIVWFDSPIKQRYTIYPTNKWKIDAGSQITFPVLPGSGYRMWINWVSESPNEKFNICGDLSGVQLFEDQNNMSNDMEMMCAGRINLSKTSTHIPSQSVFDFKIPTGVYEFAVVFNTDLWSDFIPKSELEGLATPKTPRVLSISGALLPVFSETLVSSGLIQKGYEEYNCRYIVNQAESGYIPAQSRPVKHYSDLYKAPNVSEDQRCLDMKFEDVLIEDGPIVAAEEFENFSAGVNGSRKSKIILIADSTIVQGQCPHYRATIKGNQEFIRSLYPPSPNKNLGKNWEFVQKIRAPERGSPSKYSAVSGVAIQNMISSRLWGGNGSSLSLSSYTDNEDAYNPTTMIRPEEFKPDEVKERLTGFFNNEALGSHGIYPRFSGDLLDIATYQSGAYTDYDTLLGLDPKTNRDFIVDANIAGGLTELMKINNTDYLDLDVYYSGYLGDLFGYSIDLSSNRLVVGSPFNAFYSEGAISGISGIVQWHEIKNDSSLSAIRLAEDGGAGAVFVFDKTGNGKNAVSELLPWEFTQKLKPSSLNVGIYDFNPNPIAALTAQRGPHSIFDPSYILQQAKKSDNFGLSVSIDCDMIAIGAPNHDFETLHHHVYSGTVIASGLNTAFQRKSFTKSFDIPSHSFYDLGSSGIRVDQFNNASGKMILNGGAVFNYRNELVDFQNRKQKWIFAEKLNAQGYHDRIQTVTADDIFGNNFIVTSGSDFDLFGRSVAINRSRRGDSDYTLAIGAPFHDWPTSGNHTSSGLANAGAVYTFDAMLREQVAAIPNSGGWIDARIFGQRIEEMNNKVGATIYQNTEGGSITHITTGIVFSNSNGDVFLEVSGFDPSSKGFIAHRPYVDSIYLEIFVGTSSSGNMSFYINGKPDLGSENMSLSLLGADKANVYNNMNLYQFGVAGHASGIPSGMALFTSAPNGPIDSSLNLNLTSNQSVNNLNLRVRGY